MNESQLPARGLWRKSAEIIDPMLRRLDEVRLLRRCCAVDNHSRHVDRTCPECIEELFVLGAGRSIERSYDMTPDHCHGHIPAGFLALDISEQRN